MLVETRVLLFHVCSKCFIVVFNFSEYFSSLVGSYRVHAFEVVLALQLFLFNQHPHIAIQLFVKERTFLERQHEVVSDFDDLGYHRLVNFVGQHHLLASLASGLQRLSLTVNKLLVVGEFFERYNERRKQVLSVDQSNLSEGLHCLKYTPNYYYQIKTNLTPSYL